MIILAHILGMCAPSQLRTRIGQQNTEPNGIQYEKLVITNVRESYV